MIHKNRKITRSLFPSYHNPKIHWTGKVLRVVCYKKSQLPQTHALFGVVISKKQYHTVIERNLFKRRVFHILSQTENIFDRSQYAKFIISPSVKVEDITFSDIKNDIQELLTKVC